MLQNNIRVNIEDTDYIVTNSMIIGYHTYYLLEDYIHGENRKAAVVVCYEDVEISLIVVVGHTWNSLKEWANTFNGRDDLENHTHKRIQEELDIAYGL